MKQISEIEDPRLVKALAHPIRINILRILEDRVASPRELAEELEASLSNVSYHVRFLLNLGVLELVKTVPRRGALEHYYQAVARLRITTQAWAEVPGIVKDAMIAATLQQIIGYVGAGAELGGFNQTHSHISRQPLVLDARGFKELGALLDQTLKRANDLESESAQRLQTSGHRAQEVHTGLVLMSFLAPPAAAGVPTVKEDGHRGGKRTGAGSGRRRTASRSPK